jgi:hypothetical protein
MMIRYYSYIILFASYFYDVSIDITRVLYKMWESIDWFTIWLIDEKNTENFLLILLIIGTVATAYYIWA